MFSIKQIAPMSFCRLIGCWSIVFGIKRWITHRTHLWSLHWKAAYIWNEKNQEYAICTIRSQGPMNIEHSCWILQRVDVCHLGRWKSSLHNSVYHLYQIPCSSQSFLFKDIAHHTVIHWLSPSFCAMAKGIIVMLHHCMCTLPTSINKHHITLYYTT